MELKSRESNRNGSKHGNLDIQATSRLRVPKSGPNMNQKRRLFDPSVLGGSYMPNKSGSCITLHGGPMIIGLAGFQTSNAVPNSQLQRGYLKKR